VCTNHCARMPAGSIRYSLLCREDGRALDDLLVYRDQDGVYLVVNAANSERDLQWIRAHAEGLAAEVRDATLDTAMLALQGPRSAEILALITRDVELGSIRYYRFAHGTVAGLAHTRISRTGYTGEDGFEVYFDNEHAERVWNGLMEAGAAAGVAPIGLGARDTLRLEAGMALYGHEIDAEHNPVEADLGFALSFDEAKGDWIGRAALLAVKARPTRKLVGLTSAGPRVPRQGYELYRGAEKVGTICSGAVSPTLETNIGSAYVPLALARPDTELEMDLRGKRQACRVRELPFYSRTRKKKS